MFNMQTLASKSQLASKPTDLISSFVFSTRSGTCLANEYDLVAHDDVRLAISCTQVRQCKSTDRNSGTRERVAIPIPIVGIFVLPFSWESHAHSHGMHISNDKPRSATTCIHII